MKYRSYKFVLSAAVVFFSAIAPNFVEAQSSLSGRPIKLLVGLSAGGPSDLLARTIALKLQEKLGTSIVVDNKVGAGGIVAATEVTQQPADGHTVLFAAILISLKLLSLFYFTGFPD